MRKFKDGDHVVIPWPTMNSPFLKIQIVAHYNFDGSFAVWDERANFWFGNNLESQAAHLTSKQAMELERLDSEHEIQRQALLRQFYEESNG